MEKAWGEYEVVPTFAMRHISIFPAKSQMTLDFLMINQNKKEHNRGRAPYVYMELYRQIRGMGWNPGPVEVNGSSAFSLSGARISPIVSAPKEFQYESGSAHVE